MCFKVDSRNVTRPKRSHLQMTMQTYGQIVQSYAQKPCQLMGEPPRISSMKSMEGVQRYDHTYKLSEIQVLDAQGVFLDELSARFHNIAHQLGEQVVRFDNIIHLHLQQCACIGVQRGLP